VHHGVNGMCIMLRLHVLFAAQYIMKTREVARVATTTKQVECKFNLTRQRRSPSALSTKMHCRISRRRRRRATPGECRRKSRQSPPRFARWRADAISANVLRGTYVCGEAVDARRYNLSSGCTLADDFAVSIVLFRILRRRGFFSAGVYVNRH